MTDKRELPLFVTIQDHESATKALVDKHEVEKRELRKEFVNMMTKAVEKLESEKREVGLRLVRESKIQLLVCDVCSARDVYYSYQLPGSSEASYLCKKCSKIDSIKYIHEDILFENCDDECWNLDEGDCKCGNSDEWGDCGFCGKSYNHLGCSCCVWSIGLELCDGCWDKYFTTVDGESNDAVFDDLF